MDNPEENLDKILDAIRKKIGPNSVHKGSDSSAIERISTGSLALDYATTGGIPIGRFSRLYGGFSSTKSLNCWNIISKAQKKGMSCVYYNVEKQFDKNFVSRLDVDVDKLLIIEGSVIEEIGAAMEALIGEVDLHVIDSCSSAISIDELNASVEDWHRALSARVWGKVLRRVHERFDHNRNTVILVDQIRDSMAYGGGFTVPGGKAMEHVNSMALLFRRGKWLYYDKNGVLSTDSTSSDTVSGQAEADGIEVIVKCEKSRVGRQYRTARMYLDLNKMEFDLDTERMMMAVFFGLIKQSGAWFVLPNGEKVQGKYAVRNAISESQELRNTIDEIVRNHS